MMGISTSTGTGTGTKTKTLWTPQPKQAAFLRRGEYEGLYGGAAGGGKSEALVMEALRQVHIPHYKGLILRKTFPELEELIEKSLRYYPAAFPGARYHASSHTWRFPSGAKILFGSMHRPADRLRYQGRAFDFIGFDELTHFTWEEYAYLFSRNRPNGPGTRVYLRATANPGGVGHGWVKARFVAAGPPGKTLWESAAVTFPDGHRETRRRSRFFLPASVFDNRRLLENDPAYLDKLALLPPAQRSALLYGDWDRFEGQVFTEWRDDPDHYLDRLGTHVIAPFPIPPTWRVWRGFDWGYSRPFSVGWYAADHDGRLYRFRELYGCAGTPNQGLRWEPARLAREIRRIEHEDPNLRGRAVRGVADPAVFASQGTESVAALMEREGVFFDKADHSRLSGLAQVHHRLAFDGEGLPMLYLFSTCAHARRTLPALTYDQANVEDVDSDGEDHIYDELRYICMANPISPRPVPVRRAVTWNPLDLGG